MAQRALNDYDLLKNLQENQALLKTILWRLEQMSNNPAAAQQESVEKYREFLKDVEFVYKRNTTLPEGK